MDSFGREDRNDFETLPSLFRYLEQRCFKKWCLPLITHSDEMGRLNDDFLQVYNRTSNEVQELNKTDPRFRIVQDVDYKIGLVYRNGINLALEYLLKIEEKILEQPRKVEI